MFRSWWQSLTTRTPKAPRPRRRSWLRLARLEDRTTPAVTAGLVGSRLEVHLGDTGDVANLQVVGSKIRVSDAGGVKLDVLASGVSNIDVTGDLAKSGQAVNLQSALSLIGTLSVTGVQSIDLQGALTASRGLVLNSTGALVIDAALTCTDSVYISANSISVAQPINASYHPNRPYEVHLTATGAGGITQSAEGAITAERLFANAPAGGLDLSAANTVGAVTLAALQTVTFRGTRDVAVLAGVTSLQSDVALTAPADKSITVADGQTLSAGESVTLTAGAIRIGTSAASDFGRVLAGQYLNPGTGQRNGDIELAALSGDVLVAGDSELRTDGVAGRVVAAAANSFSLGTAAGQSTGPLVIAADALDVTADSGLLLSGGVNTDVIIESDVVDIKIPITAKRCVIIRPQTPGRPIYLGVDADNQPQLRLSDAELDFLDAPSLLIGSTNSGAITIFGAIDLKAQPAGRVVNELQLLTPAAVTAETTGKLTVNGLAVAAGTGIGLAVLNDVNTFAASSTAGAVDMYDANDLTTAATVLCDNNGNVTGVTSGDDDVRIRTAGSVVIVSPITAGPNDSVNIEAVGDVVFGRGGVVTAGQNVMASAGSGGAAKTLLMTLAVGDPQAAPPKIDAGNAAALTAKTIDLQSGAGIDPLTATLTADAMNINVIVAATNQVTLEPLTDDWPIFLGVDNDNQPQLRLSDTELDFIDTQGLLIGKFTAGLILVESAIDLKAQANNGTTDDVESLQLLNRSTVTSTFPQGKLTVFSLGVSAGGAITLNSANDVAVFAAIADEPAASLDRIAFYDANDFTTGSVAVGTFIGGVTSNHKSVVLQAANTITIELNSPVTAFLNVILDAGQSVKINGGVTAGANATVTGLAGDVTIDSAKVTSGADAVFFAGQTFTMKMDNVEGVAPKINSGGNVAVTAKTIALGPVPAGVVGAGIDPAIVTLTGDTITINLPVIATECVIIETKTTGREIDLGGPDSATKLGLTDAELAFVNAPILRIGKDDTGTITVTDTIDLKTQQPTFVVNTLHLVSAADVTADAAVAAAKVSVDNLAVNTSGGKLFLPNGNDVNVFAAATRLTADFNDANNLQVGMVGVCPLPAAVTGVTTTNNDVGIKVAGAVTLAADVNAGAGTVRIEAGNNVDQLATGRILATTLGVRAGGTIDLAAENAVRNVALFAGGNSVTFRTREFLNVIEVNPPAAPRDILFATKVTGVTAAAASGAVTLSADGRLALQQPVLAGPSGVAGTGALRLTSAFGDIVQDDSGFVRALALGTLSAGSATLDSPGNFVGTFAAKTANAGAVIRLTTLANPELTIGAVAAAPLFGFDVVGIQTFNGDVALTANGLKIDQAILTGGSNCVVLQPKDPGRAILLGTENPAAALSLTQAEFDRIVAGVVQVGRRDATPAGPIALTAPLTMTTFGTLDLRTGGDIVTAGGSLQVGRLAADAAGNISLSGNNNIGVVALRAGGDVQVYRNAAIDIGAVPRCGDILAGITASCVTLDLVTPGSTFDLGTDLTQTELDLITASKGLQIGAGIIRNITVSANLIVNNSPQLDLVAAGGSVTAIGGSLTVATLSVAADAVVQLDGANRVSNLAVIAGTSVSFSDAVALTVTAATRCDGLPINGVFAVTGNAVLSADGMELKQQVRAADCVVLQPRTTGKGILFSATDDLSRLTLSDAELDFVAAVKLRVGNIDAGSITVAQIINLNGQTPTLHLQTNGDIATNADGAFIVTNLATQATGGVFLTGPNDVDQFAAAAGSDVSFNDADALTVETVDLCGPPPTLSGVSAPNGNVTLKTGQTLTLDANVVAGASVGKTITLQPLAGGVNQIDGRAITGNTLSLLGAGAFLLGKVADVDANTPFFNNVDILAANVGGGINFRDAGNLTTLNVSTGNGALNLRVQNGYSHPAGSAIDLGNGAGSVVFAMTETITTNYINGVSIQGDVKSAVPFSVFAGRFATNNLDQVTNPSGSNAFAIRPTLGTNIAIFGSFPTLADVQANPTKFPGDSLSITLPAGATSVNFLAKPGFDASFGTVQFLDANRNVVTSIEFNSIERIANLSIQAFAVQTLDQFGQDAFALSVTGTLNGQPQVANLQGSLPRATPFLAAPQLSDSSQPFRTPSLAIGDVNADGFPDLIIGLGPNSGGPLVTVLDGSKIFTTTGGMITSDLIITQYFAFDPDFNGGVTVAAADFDGDGRSEIITGQGAGVELSTGKSSQVRIVSVNTAFNEKVSNRADVLARSGSATNFVAYPGFLGGVRVSAGDVNGDGTPDIVTGAGPGGGPHVKIFFVNTSGAAINRTSETGFYAYDPSFTGGIFVDAGDVDKDGLADIVTGAGLGGGPHIRAFDGGNILSRDFRPAVDFFDAQTFAENSPTVFPQMPTQFLDSAFAYATAGVGGVGFGLGDNDDTLDIFVGTGVGRAARARFYRLIRANGSFTVPFNNVPTDLPFPTPTNNPTSTFTGERTGVSVATSAAGVLN